MIREFEVTDISEEHRMIAKAVIMIGDRYQLDVANTVLKPLETDHVRLALEKPIR